MESSLIAETNRGGHVKDTHAGVSAAVQVEAGYPFHQLQQTLGNRSLGRLIQAKLQVNQPGDVYEQEADRVADQVMRMPESTIQRKCAACESKGNSCEDCEKETVQRQEGNRSTTAGEATPLTAGGAEMTASTRNFFESRMGQDFSGVRIHSDAEAARSATNFHARAYTFGRDIVFAAGEYRPGTEAGNRLLAHELTHVVQQRHGLKGGGASIQRMLACPARLQGPAPPGWKPYHGPTPVFHCGFRGILEDRDPTRDDPQNECFYDQDGTLVDEHHPFSGCRGTPNQYDSAKHPFLHATIDSGGIARSGGGAFLESRLHDVADFFSGLDNSIRHLYGVP